MLQLNFSVDLTRETKTVSYDLETIPWEYEIWSTNSDVLSICVAMLMKFSVVGNVPKEEENGFVDPFLSMLLHICTRFLRSFLSRT